MNKFFVFAIICFLVSHLPVQCQINGFEYGINGGSGLSMLTGNGIDKNHTEPAMGYHIGGVIQYHVGKHFSLVTEPTFQQKSNVEYLVLTDNIGCEIGHVNGRNNLNYISVPILVEISFGNTTKLCFHIGGFSAFMLRNNFIIPEFSIANETYEKTKSDRTGLIYKRFDFGIEGGIGFQFPIKENFSFFSEAKLITGLYNIQSFQMAEPIYTNYVNINLGLKFKISKASSM